MIAAEGSCALTLCCLIVYLPPTTAAYRPPIDRRPIQSAVKFNFLFLITNRPLVAFYNIVLRWPDQDLLLFNFAFELSLEFISRLVKMSQPSESDLRQKRTVARGKVTRLLRDLSACDKSQEDDLALRIHHLEREHDCLVKLQIELDKLGVGDDSSHVQDAYDEIFKAKRVLARLEKGGVAAPVHDLSRRRDYNLEIKLPKFSGDIECWPEFWNLFRVAVHEYQRCTPVEKFVHLKSYLTGKAQAAVQGLPLTPEGYDKAVMTLHERFDRPDLLRESLMQRLLSTRRVADDSDLPHLRQMVDGLVSMCVPWRQCIYCQSLFLCF